MLRSLRRRFRTYTEARARLTVAREAELQRLVDDLEAEGAGDSIIAAHGRLAVALARFRAEVWAAFAGVNLQLPPLPRPSSRAGRPSP